MKTVILLVALMLAGSLAYYLNQAVANTARVAETTDLLTEIKQTARAQWNSQLDPADLTSLVQTLPWGGSIVAVYHPRGSIDPVRVLQLRLPAVPAAICPDLLQNILRQQQEGLWLRADIANAPIKTDPGAAGRKRLCINETELSIYFRF